MSREAPDNADPAMKTRRPRRKNRFRPYRSDSFPKIGIVTVCTMRKALKTHAKRFKPPKSAMIVGAAVETIVTSMKPRSSPASRPARTRGADRRSFGGSSGVAAEGFIETASPTIRLSWASADHVGPIYQLASITYSKASSAGSTHENPSASTTHFFIRPPREILRGARMFSARAGSDLERRESGNARRHPGTLDPKGCGRRQRPEQSPRGLAGPNWSGGLYRVPERHGLRPRGQPPRTPPPLHLP